MIQVHWLIFAVLLVMTLLAGAGLNYMALASGLLSPMIFS
jgi:hypothetical protein